MKIFTEISEEIDSWNDRCGQRDTRHIGDENKFDRGAYFVIKKVKLWAYNLEAV